MTIPATTNAELLARDRAHLIHPLHDAAVHEGGRVWVSGQGCVVTDADGREYLDGLSGLWNVTAGHGRHELADVMARPGQRAGLFLWLLRQLECACDRIG